MGVASDTYGSFQWGYDNTYGNTTTASTVAGISSFSSTIFGYDPARTIHFRSVATNGVTSVYGSEQTFIPSGAIVVAYNFQNSSLLTIFIVLGLMLMIGIMIKTDSPLSSILFLIIFAYLLVAFVVGINANINSLWGG
jgi:hypothetical protein